MERLNTAIFRRMYGPVSFVSDPDFGVGEEALLPVITCEGRSSTPTHVKVREDSIGPGLLY